jgi:hypothetical protein
MRKLLTVLLFTALTTFCYSQTSVDSVVMAYLRTVKDIPQPSLEITRKKGKTIRSANFFVEAMDSLAKGELKFRTFIFGSAASHNRKYFLLQVHFPDKMENKIIDDLHLEQATVTMFSFIEQFRLTDAEKAIFIRELTYAYN